MEKVFLARSSVLFQKNLAARTGIGIGSLLHCSDQVSGLKLRERKTANHVHRSASNASKTASPLRTLFVETDGVSTLRRILGLFRGEDERRQPRCRMSAEI